jgi:uncharacterized membrane protein
MAFCPNCGGQVDGRFCAKCGTAVDGGTAPGPTPTAQAGGLEENVASALCYLAGLITGIIFLVLAPYNQNKTIRFHAFQSIFLHVAVIGIYIAFIFVTIISTVISSYLGTLMGYLGLCLNLAFFATFIFLIYKAYQGEKFVLPIIGPLAEKQA